MFKKLFILSALTLFTTITAFAQEIVTVPQFSKIDIADLQMSECSFEKDVSAMYLLKYEEIDFIPYANYYQLTTTRKFRVKIFDANGFRHANLGFTYMGGDKDFKISHIEGITYNLDESGNIKASRLNTSDIYKGKGEKKQSVTSIRFTMPDIKAGCIIEYQYTVTEKQTTYISPWYFQDDIPSRLSACKVTMPYYSSLTKRVVGNFPVEEGSTVIKAEILDRQKVQRSYAVRNIPSFKQEPFMSSSKDYKQKNVERVEQ